MAFTPFYINPSGDDLNAGSTSADAGGSNSAFKTYAGGTWVAGTGVFTPASGNPVSDGVTVGMLASVYTTAGAAGTKLVGVISNVSATTITLNTAQLWGAAGNASATAAATTCKVGGAWASPLPLTSTNFGVTTVPLSTKVNVKQGTYNLAATTVSLAGTTTLVFWVDGYTTTPGDLDADTTNTLAKPVLNMTGTLTLNSSFQTWSNVSVTGSINGTTWATGAGTNMRFWRVRAENTSALVAATALTTSGVGVVFAYSWFKTPTTATTNGTATGGGTFIGCVFEGGGRSGLSSSAGTATCVQCAFMRNTGVGLLMTTGVVVAIQSTFSSPTADGIKWTGTPGNGSMVASCLFSSCAGVGINNASGANVGNVFRTCNDFYNCGTNEVGFGDAPAIYGQTESSVVLTSTTNLTPRPNTNAQGHAFPGKFENQTYTSTVTIGGVGPVPAAETSSVFGG